MADVSFLQPSPDGTELQSLADTGGGSFASRSRRLAQRVVLELLTEQGGVAYYPLRGTPFLSHLRAYAYSEADVFSAFAVSKRALQSNLLAEERPSDPPSERYLDASVAGVTVTAAGVLVRLSVTGRDGVVTAVTTPTIAS